MRRLALAVGLVAACHADARFATLSEQSGLVSDPLHVESFVLDNGLHVALLRDPRAQIASIDLRVDYGVADSDQPGLPLLVGELAARAGGDAELTTAVDVDLDRTDIAATAFDVDGAVELAARRLELACSDFDPYALSEAKDSATASLSGVPVGLSFALWGSGSPYGRGPGEPKDLAALTADDACSYYRAHFVPSAATLVVTGAFDDNFEHRLRVRFERIAKRAAAPRATVAALPSGEITGWGLARPTVAYAFAMPARGSADEVLGELAQREVATWDKDLHAALVGGRRGRALVLAMDAQTPHELGKLRDRLNDLIAQGYGPDSEDQRIASAEDPLDAAQGLDDPFHRGGAIGDLVAAGTSLERLARAKAWFDFHLTFHWMRVRVMEPKPRVITFEPKGDQPAAGSIEALADPATTSTTGLATASAPLPAVPVRAIARALTDYNLGNGMRVVLAPDPLSTLVDIRLVMPIGSRDEPEPGTATDAALGLESTDAVGWDATDKIQWYANRESIQDAAVTPDHTQFRVVGFGVLAEWHLWALAFRVTTGRYENPTGALARWKTHYVPHGATLIVSGNFDPTAIKQTIDRWFAPWHAVDPKPIVHAKDPSKPAVELADDGSFAFELGFHLPDAASPAAARVIVALVQQRLAAATRGIMDAHIAFDGGDRRVAIIGAADPQALVEALGVLDGVLVKLGKEPVPERELERARRISVASQLGDAIGASSRAHQLEERVLAGEPINRPDTIVDDARALTAPQIRAAAAALFDRANRDVIVHASRLDADRALVALGIDPRTALRR